MRLILIQAQLTLLCIQCGVIFNFYALLIQIGDFLPDPRLFLFIFIDLNGTLRICPRGLQSQQLLFLSRSAFSFAVSARRARFLLCRLTSEHASSIRSIALSGR